jgi:hypothetical protein
VFTSPCSSVATDTFGIEDLLRRCHEFVDCVQAGVCRLTVAAQLHGLYLSYLFRQRLF